MQIAKRVVGDGRDHEAVEEGFVAFIVLMNVELLNMTMLRNECRTMHARLIPVGQLRKHEALEISKRLVRRVKSSVSAQSVEDSSGSA